MAFIPASTVVAGRRAQQTALVLHGILGSGQNFRGFARRLVERRPDYTCVLVDLRNHGASVPAPPPQTIAAAADDLVRLAAALNDVPPVALVAGHSFGGKVALEYGLRERSGISEVWVLDSDPGTQQPAADNEIARVLRAVRSVPMPTAERSDVVAALRAEGLSQGLSNWMTTNLRREGDRYTWTFDLDAIELLLKDYYHSDLWPQLEQPKASPVIHLVIAQRSERWSPAMRERAARLAEETMVHCHVLPNAGHWLHVDNPDGLLELMADRMGAHLK